MPLGPSVGPPDGRASVSLTRRGVGALASAVVLVLSGRVLGLLELTMLGLALSAVVVVALTAAWWPLWRAGAVRSLEVRRCLLPRRLHAGGVVQVRVEVRNRSGRRSPPLGVRTGTARAPLRAALGPLGPREHGTATHRVPATRRGLLDLGPVVLEHEDPFGAARASRAVLPPASVLVYPALEPVDARLVPGEEEPPAAARAAAAGGRAEDWTSLKAYEIGDDVRRIHWPASAHTGELVIRREEPGRTPRLVLLVDTRARRHSQASFERVLSLAASLALEAARRHVLVRLVTTGGVESGSSGTRAHLSRLLERLALAEPEDGAPTDGLLPLLRAARRARDEGALVLTTTAAPAEELAALLAAGGGGTSVLACATGSGSRALRTGTPGGGALGRVAVLEQGQPLATAWPRLVHRPQVPNGGEGR
jgi:uncharacterized protein (DUF58 family)